MPAALEREVAGPPAPQLCGRCRGIFAGDATLPHGVDTGWWACAPCRAALLGRAANWSPVTAPVPS